MRLALILALLALQARAENKIVRARGFRAEVEKALASAALRADIRLPRFDDPGLISGALQALSRGAKVRLIAAKNDKSTRAAARRLADLGILVRWSGKGGPHALLIDGKQLLVGGLDGGTESMDEREESLGVFDDTALLAEFEADFESAWKRSVAKLPRVLTLSDELEALPDPRDVEPRLKTKRRIR